MVMARVVERLEWLEIASRFSQLGERRLVSILSAETFTLLPSSIIDYFVLFSSPGKVIVYSSQLVSRYLIYLFDPQDPTIILSFVLPVEPPPDHDATRIQVAQS